MKKSWLAVVAAIAVVAVVSVVVVRSSDDDSRRQGALEESEAVSLTWRGDWSPEVAYAGGSVVSHEGTAYVAEVAEPKPGAAPAGGADSGWAALANDAALTPAPTLTSPDGRFKIEVADTGILLSGPNNVSALLSADSLTVNLPNEFKVQAGASANVKSGGTLSLESSSNGVVKSPVLTLGCAGSGSRPVARMNDTVTGSANLLTGSLTSTIGSGSSKVFAC
jgi:hypothetical protein